MSLRLNKAIGYALTDLVPDDPRISQDSPLLNWTRFEEEEDEHFVAPNFEGYVAWLQEAAAAGTGWVRNQDRGTVPSDLRRLAEYGQLFTSDDAWKSLRPVHYRYWV